MLPSLRRRPSRIHVPCSFEALEVSEEDLWILGASMVDRCIATAIRLYSTLMKIIGRIKKMHVDARNHPVIGACLNAHMADSSIVRFLGSLILTTPYWSAIGMAVHTATIHTQAITRAARGRLDIFCAFIGKQMATYRSTVKAVIVSMEVLVEISQTKARITHSVSPNTQGYSDQTEYRSGGSPITSRRRSATARLNR